MNGENNLIPLIVTILFLVIIVAISFYIFDSSNKLKNVPVQKVEIVLVKIINSTNLNQEVVLPNEIIDLQPGKEVYANLYSNTIIYTSSTRYDDQNDLYKLRLESAIGNTFTGNGYTVYITNDGFSTNSDTSTNIEFINQSDYPILFVQNVEDRRLPLTYINPHSTVQRNSLVLKKRSVIEAIYAVNENITLDSLMISGLAKRITFDNINGLTAE